MKDDGDNNDVFFSSQLLNYKLCSSLLPGLIPQRNNYYAWQINSMSIRNTDPLNERGYKSRIGPQIINEDGEINIPKFITNEQNFIYFGEIILFLFFIGVICAWRLARFCNTTADHASEVVFDLARGDRSILLERKRKKEERKKNKVLGSRRVSKKKLKQKYTESWVVIGGSGFIGNAIVKQILNDKSLGHIEVIVFDRNIPEDASDRDDRVTYVQGTMTIRDHLDRLMRINDRWDNKIEVVEDLDEFEEIEEDDDGNYIGIQQEGMLEPGVEDKHLRKCKYPPTCVFLCAGITPSLEHMDDDFQLINGMGSMNVIDSCVAAKVNNFVFTSCASVALSKGDTPNGTNEAYYHAKYCKGADDDSIPYSFAKQDFIDLNAKYKAITEDYIKDICKNYVNFRAISLRPSVVVGKTDNQFLQPMLRGEQM